MISKGVFSIRGMGFLYTCDPRKNDVHARQGQLWVPPDLLHLEAPWRHHPSRCCALPRWPGDNQEDMDLDREVGEALISDYFSGAVQLHYLLNLVMVQIICNFYILGSSMVF